MTAINQSEWIKRLDAFETQDKYVAKLCKNLVAAYNPQNRKTGDRIGFTLEQYQAALKCLSLAIELFSTENPPVKLEEVKLKLSVSQISAKLMWEDLCKSNEKLNKDEYESIQNLALRKLQELG
jgi:hypothetical protein